MSFEAKYHSQCWGDCGEQIAPGDQVEYLDDFLVHAHCDPQADDPAAPSRNERRCTDCFTTHAGECL